MKPNFTNRLKEKGLFWLVASSIITIRDAFSNHFSNSNFVIHYNVFYRKNYITLSLSDWPFVYFQFYGALLYSLAYKPVHSKYLRKKMMSLMRWVNFSETRILRWRLSFDAKTSLPGAEKFREKKWEKLNLWKEEKWPLDWYLVCFRKPVKTPEKSDRKKKTKKITKIRTHTKFTRNEPPFKETCWTCTLLSLLSENLETTLKKASKLNKKMPQRNRHKTRRKLPFFHTRNLAVPTAKILPRTYLWPQTI